MRRQAVEKERWNRLSQLMEARSAPPPTASTQADPPLRIRSRGVHVLAALATMVVLVLAKAIVLPVILAVIVGLLFRPLVRWLEAHWIPASIGAAAVMVVLAAAGAWFASMLAEPLTEWLNRMPEAAQRARGWFEQVREPIDQIGQAARRMEEAASLGGGSLRAVEIRDGGWWNAILGGTRELIAGGLIAATTCYFLLACGGPVLRRLISMIPNLHAAQGNDLIFGMRRDETAEMVLHEIEWQVFTYLGTITAINAGLGIATGLLTWAVGLPDPLLWGVLAFSCNYIPYIGPCAVLVVLSLVSFTTLPATSNALIAPVGFLVFINLEGNALTPFIIGRHFSMNPLVIFLWMVLMTWMWGIAGAFLALPILILVRIFSARIQSMAWIRDLIDP